MYIELILAIVVLVVCMAVVVFLDRNHKARAIAQQREIDRLQDENCNMHKLQLDYVRKVAEQGAQLSTKEEQLQNQKRELLETRETMNKDFQLLANKILEEKTEKFTASNKRNIEDILKPLSEKLVEFRSKVEETYDKESKQRFSLEERIKELVVLNSQISEDANNLTKALKGNGKVQGDWGEMILESILEKSGLKKGEEYYAQEFIMNADGNRVKNTEGNFMQPDIVVVYPGGRKIVLDSKVSLSAYVRYAESDTDQARMLAEKEHLVSVKKHIDELSKKSYQDYIDSLDFVMMFVPNEPAYILAMQLDANLWDYAYKKRILLISPTNLIASLKVVSDLWKREYQSRNAQEIADRGAKLYDKFVGFVETLNLLGKDIEKTQKTYNESILLLKDGKGNLIRQAEILKELGVKGKKELPESSI